MEITSGRLRDLTDVDATDPIYLQEGVVPLGSETHGGEDVAIYARGPKGTSIPGHLGAECDLPRHVRSPEAQAPPYRSQRSSR